MNIKKKDSKVHDFQIFFWFKILENGDLILVDKKLNIQLDQIAN